MKKLTSEEILKMELNDANNTIFDLYLKIAELELQVLSLHVDKKAMQHSITYKDLEIAKLDSLTKKTAITEKIKTEKLKKENRAADHKDFSNSLKEKYKLKDRWGFDPETGEIADDDNQEG